MICVPIIISFCKKQLFLARKEDVVENKAVISKVIDNLRRVFQILNEQSKKVEKETGLTGPQLWAIKVIYENAPLNLSDLSGRLYLHCTTVVGIVDRLETHNLVKRTRSKDDRRMVWIDLTAKGKSLIKNAPEVAQGLLVAGLEELSATRLVEIDRSMRCLVKIFGAQKTPPKLIRSSEVNLPKRKMKQQKEK
jgi:MarR family transcriptional regulator, organic hydroperoxide resistance regulator